MKGTSLLLQIVWDPEKKRWTNVNGDDEEGSSDLPPPPKASELPAVTKGLSAAGGEGHRSLGSNMLKRNGKMYFIIQKFKGHYIKMLVPVAERSRALVYGRSLAGIAGSNPAGGMDGCPL